MSLSLSRHQNVAKSNFVMLIVEKQFFIEVKHETKTNLCGQSFLHANFCMASLGSERHGCGYGKHCKPAKHFVLIESWLLCFRKLVVSCCLKEKKYFSNKLYQFYFVGDLSKYAQLLWFPCLIWSITQKQKQISKKWEKRFLESVDQENKGNDEIWW